MLIGRRIKLRPTETRDLEVFRQWINNWEVCRGVLRYLPVADWEHKSWFKSLKKDKSQIYFSIESIKDKKYIGNIGLKNINWKDRKGDLFIYIGEETERGNGYGFEAVENFVRYCFDVLNLHKICLGVIVHNKAAIETYLKAGFKQEGLLKEEVFQDGEYHDLIRMGIINKK
jgi:RimJ/RimL family protein N-acetyltransferase